MHILSPILRTANRVFANNNAVIIAVIIAILIISVLAISSWFFTSHETQSLLAIEEAQRRYLSLGNTDEQSQEAVMEQLQEIIELYQDQYASARAMFIIANIYQERGEWNRAIDYWNKLFNTHSNSHLKYIALYNTSVALEEAGNTVESISTLERLVEEVEKSGQEGTITEHPRALLSLGRLYESQSKQNSAINTYNKLIDTYSNSSWSNFAQNRVLKIKIIE